VQGLQPFASSELTVTIASASNVSIGTLHIGILKALGTTLYNPFAQPKSYSYIQVDEFGENVIIPRNSALDINNITANVLLTSANEVVRTLTNVLDKAVPWIVSDSQVHSGLRTIGIGNGTLIYDNPNNCTLRLNIRGLI
jgi:hypothetical protein